MFLVLSLVGCGGQLPEPTLLQVVPDRGWNGEDTIISIEGTGFYPQVGLNANRADQVDLDRGFVARLDGPAGLIALSSVSAVNYEHLRAVVDPGLPEGLYDLVVEGPTGRLARLEDAFTVSPTRADRLSLTSPNIVATVNESVPIQIQLLDPTGEPVPADLGVRLTFTGASGDLNATWGVGLDDQLTVAGNVVTGRLGPDGGATLPLAVHRPDTLSMTVEPLDPESTIQGDVFAQVWRPGGELVVRITLPPEPFEAYVGDRVPLDLRLEDQFGNLVTDVPTNITLRMACGSELVSLSLTGEGSTSIRPVRATDYNNTCTEQYVEVVNGPSGRSPSFVVHAGEASSFDVDVPFSTVRAGNQVIALITTRDGFGNRTLVPENISLADSVDGLGPSQCVPSPSGDRSCIAMATVAAENITLRAIAGSIEGESPPYSVLPGTDVSEVVVETLSAARAGSPTPVGVAVSDAFGNQMLPEDLNNLTVLSDLPTELCEALPPLPDGRFAFSCHLNSAREDAVLTASTDGVIASTPPFTIRNGPAAQAVLITPSAAVAGVPFEVDVTIFDAYGNAYTAPIGGSVNLIDDAGEINLPLSTSDGAVTVEEVVTIAGVDRLSVESGGAIIGAGDPIVIAPGPGVELKVRQPEPWAFTAIPIETRVEVLDAFGNRGVESPLVNLTSDNGPPVDVNLVNGSAVLTYTYTSPMMASVLSASGGGMAGQSAPIDVAVDCGLTGPTAEASFAGAPMGRVCTDPSGAKIDVTLSLATSGVGNHPLIAYRSFVENDLFTSTTPTFAVSVAGPGRAPLRALVIDDGLCGSEVESAIWSGPDDGSAVGELQLLGPSTLALGASASLSLEGAVDCTGDPASSADLRVQTNLGVLTSVARTGEGLRLSLDLSGSASFGLSTSSLSTGETALIEALTDGGGARGELSIAVVGDDRAPVVWHQAPAGETFDLIEEARLLFSEPLLEATVSPLNFSIIGPAPTTITGAVLEGTEVTLSLSPPVDPSLGTWTLTASDSLRDEAGNRLDGREEGSPSPWVQTFGLLTPAVDPLTCTLSTAVFRPDGDPGLGTEADEIEVLLESDSTPAVWIASVRDNLGRLLVRERVMPNGPLDTWAWDGRGVDERIVNDGDYSIEVRAGDGFGNTVDGCVQSVVVDRYRSHE